MNDCHRDGGLRGSGLTVSEKKTETLLILLVQKKPRKPGGALPLSLRNLVFEAAGPKHAQQVRAAL